MNDHPHLLQIFNEYLEKGGEEAAVNRISESLGQVYPFESCNFSSRAWQGEGAPPAWKQAAWMLYNPDSVQKLREVQARHRADLWIVNNVFPVGSGGVFREALRQRIPVLYYIHNFRPFSVNGYLWAADALAPGGLRRKYWKEIRHASWQNSHLKTAWFAFVLHAMRAMGWFGAIKGWIAISEFMRQKFIQAGVPAGEVHTIPHFWRPTPAEPLGDGKHFLFLGRLIAAKGLWVLLDAWSLIEKALGDRAPQLVIGGAGPMEQEIRSAIAAFRRVEFVGHVSGGEKRQLIRGCTAMIAPSVWWEPLGLVTYEAYDSCKPMLAARSGGLTETVIHGKTGFLHAPGAEAELAEQVIQLHGDPALCREMGANGRAWLLENTNEDLWRERFRMAIASVLS